MVDYCLIDPEILTKLESLGALDVKTIIDCGYPSYTEDAKLVWDGTVKENRVLLTGNYKDINERIYPPCLHGGIILINHPRPTPDIVYAYVKTLLQCGKRKFAKNHVTHLTREAITIVTHDKDSIRVNINEKPSLRKIVSAI